MILGNSICQFLSFGGFMLRRKVTDRLLSWKNNSNKALLVTGARQIGKSYAIRAFGKSNYASYFEVNLLLDARCWKPTGSMPITIVSASAILSACAATCRRQAVSARSLRRGTAGRKRLRRRRPPSPGARDSVRWRRRSMNDTATRANFPAGRRKRYKTRRKRQQENRDFSFSEKALFLNFIVKRLFGIQVNKAGNRLPSCYTKVMVISEKKGV